MPGYSQDYIKRLIEQLGELWHGIITLLKQNDVGRAEARLDAAYREFLHMDRDLVHGTSDDFLVLAVGIGRTGDVDKVLALADLLRIEAEIFEKKGDEAGRDICRVKALNVLCEALARSNHSGSSEHVERIDALVVQVQDAALSAPTLLRMHRMYEARGQFDKAEDRLFELLDIDGEQMGLGYAFYERLQALPDHVLVEGGLPREEVDAALEELDAR
jgi:tetratricopeptide (TPR) repeat protein